MSSRVTTAQLAEKLDKLIELMTVAAVAAPSAPVSTPVTEGDEAETSTIKVDEAYLAHMNLKAAAHATDKGSEVVLYARKNKQGETKLAYALRERYDTQIERQPSHLGAVGTFQA
jgi:hypothetical protein